MKTVYKSKYSWQLFFSLLTILIGTLLLIYMVTVENEPGGIPLLLIFVGAGWLARIQYLKRRQIEQ